MVVWKYALSPLSSDCVRMPRGARVLHVDVQGDQICLWALVNPGAETEDRRLIVVGTGHPLPPGPPESFRHLGTALLHEGAFVVHVFEEGS